MRARLDAVKRMSPNGCKDQANGHEPDNGARQNEVNVETDRMYNDCMDNPIVIFNGNGYEDGYPVSPISPGPLSPLDFVFAPVSQ